MRSHPGGDYITTRPGSSLSLPAHRCRCYSSHVRRYAYLGSTMSQSEKAQYYSALKNEGIEFDKHYRDYTTEELKNAYGHLKGDPDAVPPSDTIPAEDVLDEQAETYGPADGPVEEPPSEFFGLHNKAT